MAVTLKDFWRGRDVTYAQDLTDEIRRNAAETVRRANELLACAGVETFVTSGWRPPSVNARIANAAPRSKHMTGQAVDLADGEGELAAWVVSAAGVAALEQIALWCEDPRYTRGWVHVQTVPPRSGRRFFIP